MLAGRKLQAKRGKKTLKKIAKKIATECGQNNDIPKREIVTGSGARGVSGFSGKPPGFMVRRHPPSERNDAPRFWLGCGTVG